MELNKEYLREDKDIEKEPLTYSYDDSEFMWDCEKCDREYPQNAWSLSFRYGWTASCLSCFETYHVYLGNCVVSLA